MSAGGGPVGVPGSAFRLLLELLNSLIGASRRFGHLTNADLEYWRSNRERLSEAATQITERLLSPKEVEDRVRLAFDLDGFRRRDDLRVETRCFAYALARQMANQVDFDTRAYYAVREDSADGTGFMGRSQLQPGDPVPLRDDLRLPAERRDYHRRGAVRGALPYEQEPFRVSERLTLAPPSVANEETQCWIDFSFSNVDLALSSKFATGHPFVDPRHEYQSLRTTGTFASPDEVLNLVNSVVATAGSKGAHLVILPEVAISATIEEEVYENWLSLEASDRPRVLVAGSCWANGTNGSDNRVSIRAIDNQGVVRHGSDQHKMEAVRTNVPPLYTRRSDRREQLGDHERTLTIYVLHNGLKLAVAICRDVLSGRVSRLFEDLEVDIVAIPAMTPKTVPFEVLAAYWP